MGRPTITSMSCIITTDLQISLEKMLHERKKRTWPKSHAWLITHQFIDRLNAVDLMNANATGGVGWVEEKL